MLEIRKEYDLFKNYESFIDYIDVTQKSIEGYKNGIKNLKLYLDENGIDNPTRSDIKKYRDYILTCYSANTVNTYMTAIREFFKYLQMLGIYSNIALDIKGARTSTTPKKQVLAESQVQEIYNNLTDKREKALFGLLVTTGLRGVEIVDARIEDLRVFNNEITLWIKCKGHSEKDEYVKISEIIFSDLKEYLEGRKEGYIFVGNGNNNRNNKLTTKTIRLIIKNIFKRFGLDDESMSLHSTRRTFATLAYENGSDIYSIQQVLHHKSINTTTIYLKSADRNKNNSEYNVSKCLIGEMKNAI